MRDGASKAADEQIVAQTRREKDTDEVRSTPGIEPKTCQCCVVISPTLRSYEVAEKKQRQEIEEEERRAEDHTEEGENNPLTLPGERHLVN